MLKHRLILGTSMIAGLLILLTLDAKLDKIVLTDTFLQTLFMGRTVLPRGILLLSAILLIGALASKELVHIFHAKGIEANQWVVVLAVLVGGAFMYTVPAGMDSQEAIALFATLLVCLCFIALVRHSFWSHRTQGAISVAGATLFAMIYLGVLPGFYLLIRRWHDVWIIAAIILVTKSCDIGAYFTGRLLGRHKLIPWLSPGKTWEGLLGGVCFSMLLAIGLCAISNHYNYSGHFVGADNESQFIHQAYPLWGAAIAGVFLGLFGQAGDLIASLLKRDAGLKDSGHSVPGFGGLLDVLDSPILTAPIAYWLLHSLLS